MCGRERTREQKDEDLALMLLHMAFLSGLSSWKEEPIPPEFNRIFMENIEECFA